jgi:hypothetical protein
MSAQEIKAFLTRDRNRRNCGGINSKSGFNCNFVLSKEAIGQE